MEYYSQSWVGQDKLVAETLNFKKDGFFVDIGCHHYQDISNTYFFEKNLNWRGLAVDINQEFQDGWKTNRPNSLFVCADATTVDYAKYLKEMNAPAIIDYLTVDTEPPERTLECLRQILKAPYIFRTITFETDHYTGNMAGLESRNILKERGYVLVKEIGQQDDFWTHPSLVG